MLRNKYRWHYDFDPQKRPDKVRSRKNNDISKNVSVKDVSGESATIHHWYINKAGEWLLGLIVIDQARLTSKICMHY